MPSDAGSEPVDWGTSFGRFGSDSSADAEGPQGPRQPAAKRRGLARSASSSFGSPSSGARSARGTGWGAARTGRRSSGRPPADDPFGPVVGSSADGGDDEDALRGGRRQDARSASSPGGRSGGRSARNASARGTSGEGPADEPRGRRRSGGTTARRGRSDEAHGPGGSDISQPGESLPEEFLPDGSLPGFGSPPDGNLSAAAGSRRTDEEWTSEARSILLRQLALGARSRHQLAVKLADRDIPAAVAGALLDRFEEVQLIDDAEFARMWVRTRTAAKALSRTSLRRELADKGIDPDLAEDALLQISDEDEHTQARDVVRRKLRGSADLSDRAVRDKEMRRLVGVLARKGYSPGTAFSIVKDVIADARTQD